MDKTKIGSGSPAGGMIVLNAPPTSTTVTSIGGTVSDEWLDRPDHPLMNKLVLDTIFEQLGDDVLKECRLVCKTWNVCTIPYTRKEFLVTIYAKSSPEEKLHTIDNFVEVFRLNDLGIPFAKFELGSFCTTNGVGQEFLQLCGKMAKDIEFSEDTFRVEDLSELLKSTPKLETLQIPKHLHSRSGNIVKLFPEDSKPRLASLKDFTVFYDNPKERNQVCPTFLEELIMVAENISCVTLYDSFPVRGEEDYMFSSFEVLSLIEKLGRESSVQEITISLTTDSNDSECAELLNKMVSKRNGLKLKKLHYQTNYSGNQHGKSILQVISLFKDTLESLEMRAKQMTSFMEFSKMTRLTNLDVYLYKGFNFRFVNLSKIFPVLETLELSNMSDDIYDEFFPDSEPCPTLKTLELFEVSLNVSGSGFNQMLTTFPNLIDFRLTIKKGDESILKQIYTRMTQLESLSIFGTIQRKSPIDCVFTGMPVHVLQEIRDVVKNLEEMTEGERRERILSLRNQHSQLPSIGNLTKLRSLTLELTGDGDMRCNGKHLTDVTGYLGFYSIKSLKELYVEKCEMTKTCCEILTQDMGLQSWTFKASEEDIIPSDD